VIHLASSSQFGDEPRETVMLGLDPSIARSAHAVRRLSHCFLRVATDARVKPEHDVERSTTGQIKNCRHLADVYFMTLKGQRPAKMKTVPTSLTFI
jgi:hypothetical protein